MLCDYTECNTEHHYVVCHFSECHDTVYHYAVCYANCHYVDCHFSECHYAGCCYAGYRFVSVILILLNIVMPFVRTLSVVLASVIVVN